MNEEQWQTRKRLSKRTIIIILAVVGVVIIAAITVFCTVLLPDILRGLEGL